MDTPLDPAQTKGRLMNPTRAPRLATLEARAQRILAARTLAETIVFRSKTAGFHSKFDHSLVTIERGTRGGYLLEILERGEMRLLWNTFTVFSYSSLGLGTKRPVGAIGNRSLHLRGALHPGDGDASSLRFTPGHDESATGPRFIPLDKETLL